MNHLNLSRGMRSAAKLGEALKERGYLVSVEGDQLMFAAGNGERDYADVRRLLEEAGMPVLYAASRMQILSPVLPMEVLRRVRSQRVEYGRAYIPERFHTWKAFAKRNHGVRWDSLSLDRGIAYLAKTMSEAGILVTGGCDGHGKHAPKVYLASDWAAAWMAVVMEEFLERDELYYRWEIKPMANGSPQLTAVLGEGQRWMTGAVRADGVVIGEQLRKLAPMLRKLRRDRFKYRSMRSTAEALKGDHDALLAWMTALVKGGAGHV